MVADGADGRFRGRTYSNHPASGAAFTAEGNLYAEGSQERLRAPQAIGDFWPPGPTPAMPLLLRSPADTQEVGGATSPGAALGHERTKAANGSASMASSTAALPLAGWARANVPTGQIEVSQAAAQKAKSAISEAADRRATVVASSAGERVVAGNRVGAAPSALLGGLLDVLWSGVPISQTVGCL